MFSRNKKKVPGEMPAWRNAREKIQYTRNTQKTSI